MSIKTNTMTGQSAAYAQHTSADNLINKNKGNELSVLHVNIRSLTKNISDHFSLYIKLKQCC